MQGGFGCNAASWIVCEHSLSKREEGTFKRSMPYASRLRPLTTFSMGLGPQLGKVGRYSFSLVTPGQIFSSGVPRILKILYNWSISLSPWKRAFLVTISAKMQPIAQISIGVEYYTEPRRISGARYHSVTTSCE